MNTWFERNPRRYERELIVVKSSSLNLRLEKYTNFVGWQGTVDVDDKTHYLRIIYPLDFPTRPPWVCEMAPFTDEVLNDVGTYHQMLDGSLCLFALGDGPDVWNPEFTVEDVINRYKEFRLLANQGGHVNDHGRPLRNCVGYERLCPLILTNAQALILQVPLGWGWIYAHPMVTQSALVAGRVAACDENIKIDADITPWFILKETHKFSWFSIKNKSINWRCDFPDLDSIKKILPGVLQVDFDKNNKILLVHENKDKIDCRLVWNEKIFGIPTLFSSFIEVFDFKSCLFNRVDGVMSGRSALDQWRIIMIGLGSLGGSVAVHLARAGVSKFTLFDPDIMRPENIVRHVVGRNAVYLPKSVAVKGAILDRNPWANVECHVSSPLWDGDPKASQSFERLLGEANTIIVVTTADHQVERAINSLAVQQNVPAIYASVLGQADHGRVFRVLPRASACYQCVVDAQRLHPERFFREEEVDTREMSGLAGYRQPGIPGIGIDVEFVALHAARFVLQTLSRLNGGQPSYADAVGHHLVWTNRGGSEFDTALQIRWEPYERRPECGVCGTISDDDVIDSSDLSLLERELKDPLRMFPKVHIFEKSNVIKHDGGVA